MRRTMAAIAVAGFLIVLGLTAVGGSARAEEPYPSKPIRPRNQQAARST